MTAIEQVQRTKRDLGLVAGVTAALWGAGVTFGALVVAMLLSLLVPFSPGFRAAVLPVALLAGVGALFFVLWRRRFVWSVPRVALWVEERVPELRYALMTAIDSRYAEQLGERLAPIVAKANPGAFVRRAAWRSLLPAGFVLLLTGATFVVMPATWREAAVGVGAVAAPAEAEMPSRLEVLRGSVTPPAYAIRSGHEVMEFDDPASIAGLVGSQVDLHGLGIPDGIEIVLGETPLEATQDGSQGWMSGFTMPDSAVALELRDRQYRRLVVIAPRTDEAPSVELLLPMRDTTVRVVRGDIALQARMSDDIGLGGAFFESIVTMGQEEGHITFRRDTLERRGFSGARNGEFAMTIPLADFRLGEGDMLSLRAVAFDNNTMSGPSYTTSETRVLRVATSSEYDSLAIEGAPPPNDTLFLTLRFIIQLTEEIHADRDRLDRDLFVDSAQTIGLQLRRVIRTVEQMQVEWTMEGVFDANPLLAEAHEALWEGARALYIAETGEALPPLWAALALLEEFALAERYYFRGQPPELLVNLGRVRLQGTDTGYAEPRVRRPVSGELREEMLEHYTRSVQFLETAPDSAVNALMLMQVDALREYPDLASFLGEAINAIRDGEDASAPLANVRRYLEGETIVRRTLTSWSAMWLKR
ncbi:MAG: hypothetical protein OXI71_07680 [Gemmatimonadota bacterium]|nr:hypothetical protein [Gemmatimonadota bacterium]